MSNTDYIPKAYGAKLVWLKNLVSYSMQNQSRLGLMEGMIVELNIKVSTYELSCEQANNPNAGKVDKFDRKEKAGIAVAAAREFVNSYLRYNAAVTDDDRLNLGLTIPDTTPTPVGPPDTWPLVSIRDGGPRMLRVIYRDSVSESRAKPEGVHGCEIRHAILPAPPVNEEALLRSDFSTRSPHVFTYTQDLRGQTVYFVLRWESSRGQKGPWSEIYSGIIP